VKNFMILFLFTFLIPSPVKAEGPVDFAKGQIQTIKSAFGKEGKCVRTCKKGKPYCSYNRSYTCPGLELGHCDEDDDWVACKLIWLDDGTLYCETDGNADAEICPAIRVAMEEHEAHGHDVRTREGRPFCLTCNTDDPSECPDLPRRKREERSSRHVYSDADDYVRPTEPINLREVVGRMLKKDPSLCDNSEWVSGAICDGKGHAGRYCGIYPRNRPGPWSKLRPIGFKIHKQSDCGDGDSHSAYEWWGSSNQRKQ
jgi:hypothetical protein